MPFLVIVSRQAHVYIIAGACLSLGFRFAGSENLSAFNCLVRSILVYSILFSFFTKPSYTSLNFKCLLLFFQHKFAKDFMTYLSAPNASVVSLLMMSLLGNKTWRKFIDNSVTYVLLNISGVCLNLEWEIWSFGSSLTFCSGIFKKITLEGCINP